MRKIAESSTLGTHLAAHAVALVFVALGCSNNGGGWGLGNGVDASSGSSGGASGPGGATGSSGGSGGTGTSTGGSTGPSSGSSGSSGGEGSSGSPDASTDDGSGDDGSGDEGALSDAPAGSGDGGSCETDPLKTGNMQQDAYDCMLLALAQMYGDPDPMMAKAQMQTESGFNVLATSPDSPCGDPAGWTDAESKSFGLIQVTPACGEENGALLPDGQPNLEMDMSSADWATSVYNPTVNLDAGVQSIAGALHDLESSYPGCTTAQYVEMSAGAYNSGEGAVSGCNAFNSRAQGYVNAVLANYHQFAQAAGWPDPY